MAATPSKWHSLLLVITITVACLQPTTGQTIITELAKAPGFSSFVGLLRKSGLVNILENQLGSKGSLTFFAPRNSYLEDASLKDVLDFLKDNENVGLLAQVLLLHVTPQPSLSLPKPSLSNTYDALNDRILLTTAADGTTVVSHNQTEALVAVPNAVVAKVGAVHGIDGLLIPTAIAVNFTCPKFGVGCAEAPSPGPSAQPSSPTPSSPPVSPPSPPSSSPSPSPSPSKAPPPPNTASRMGVQGLLTLLLATSTMAIVFF